MRDRAKTANMVFSDRGGRIYVHPFLKAMGSDARGMVLPETQEWISLPAGSTFFYLPGHHALGFDPSVRRPVVLKTYENMGAVYPVSGFLVPGHTRLCLPAARKVKDDIVLPLWPYTAVGYRQGHFVVAAARIDAGRKQRPCYYQDAEKMARAAQRLSKIFPLNRLVGHLRHCALQYHCRNAQNLFLGRWEAPLPVSPSCNSRCLGCLSAAETDDASSHRRIDFVPAPEEISDIAVHHLKNARAPIVSFGQGCEGEPLLQFDVVAQAIRRMRRATRRGTIHMNTNGFDPRRIRALAACGLDSVRVSTVSFHPAIYEAYYRPRGYRLADVLASIHEARKAGLFVSLNYLTLPGLSDRAQEVARLMKVLKTGSVDLLQLRNLCIDPGIFWKKMPAPRGRPLGMTRMIHRLRQACPGLRLGYFNLPKENFCLN